MIVSVEKCWGGGDRYYKRFTIQSKGHYQYIRAATIPYDGDNWPRAKASEALNRITSLTGCNRNSIKYDYRN